MIVSNKIVKVVNDVNKIAIRNVHQNKNKNLQVE
jgi:hypothetical protein